MAGQHLGSFSNTAHDEDRDNDWSYGNNGDGSFYARKPGDNAEYFPTEGEAKIYAELRAGGFLHVGALMTLMDRRVQVARKRWALHHGGGS